MDTFGRICGKVIGWLGCSDAPEAGAGELGALEAGASDEAS